MKSLPEEEKTAILARLDEIEAELPKPNGNGNGHASPKIPEATEEAEIARLAKLSLVQYDRERVGVAKLLGIRPTTLDKAVTGAREKPDNKRGSPLTYPEIEPWPEAVDIAGTLHETSIAIRRYVDLHLDVIDAIALWVAHTYCHGVFYHSPRLAITSPEKQCGKTTLSDVLKALVWRPEKSIGLSGAALFRTVELAHPTMILDEMDNSLPDNPDLLAVLNDGHTKNGNTVRCVEPDYEPRRFSTSCAASIALIGRLPDTLADRSIHIEMRRRKLSTKLECFREDKPHAQIELVRRQLVRWSQDACARLTEFDPEMPDGLYNRQADNWRSLFAIAQCAGGEWPTRAERALRSTTKLDETGVRTMLLADVRDICAARGRDTLVSSVDVVMALKELEGRPWPEWKNGKPITTNQLARMLGPFGVVPVKSDSVRGYRLFLMEEAIERYLPCGGDYNRPTALNADETGTSELFATAL